MLNLNNDRRLAHYLLLLLLQLILLTFAGAVGFYLAKSTHASGPSYNVWTWNIAGMKENAGSTTNGMTDVAVHSIIARNADLIAFQEICKNQFDDIETKLRQRGWNLSANFSAWTDSTKGVNQEGGCPPGKNNEKREGDAIFVRQGIADLKIHRLTMDPGNNLPKRIYEKRSMLCAKVSGTDVRFCGTHLTTTQCAPKVAYNVLRNSNPGGNDCKKDANGKAIDDGLVKKQANQVRSILRWNYFDKGERIIIAGDFNSQPNYGRLNEWYSSKLSTPNNRNNTGVYREVDDNDARCPDYGEWTATGPGESPCGGKAKIDMIFFREKQVSQYRGESLALGETCKDMTEPRTSKLVACSDHRILIGSILFKD